MQSDMNIVSLVADATLIVQMVLLILVVSSVVSWGIIINRWHCFRETVSEATEFENNFWSVESLSRFYDDISSTEDLSGMSAIFHTGFQEYVRLHKQGKLSTEAIADTSVRAMRVVLSREIDRLSVGLNFLSIAGSTAPYVGLFGTVWGIMHAFLALQNIEQAATLSLVAPGIAEALVATAIGLFTAIPAVIAYNHYTQKTNSLISRYDNFIEEFTTILHKQVLHSQR